MPDDSGNCAYRAGWCLLDCVHHLASCVRILCVGGEAVLYEEAIQAEKTGELVSITGSWYRILRHKKLANSGHYAFVVQRQTLGIPCEQIEIDEQTLAYMRRAKR